MRPRSCAHSVHKFAVFGHLRHRKASLDKAQKVLGVHTVNARATTITVVAFMFLRDLGLGKGRAGQRLR